MSGPRALVALLAVLAMVAAACGGRDSDSGEQPPPTAPPADSPVEVEPTDDAEEDAAPSPVADADPCATEATGDVDLGVTADTITVLVAADVGSPLAPGLFQDSIDGIDAWAAHVNAEGGLACRQVEVIEFDTALNGNESVNAQIRACDEAVAMVGTTALFVFDVENINSCPDVNGDPTGIPDLAGLMTEAVHQCSANSLSVVPPTGACPFESGERLFRERVGHIDWYRENVAPELAGVFIIPGDLPSTRQTGVTSVRGYEAVGLVNRAEFAVSGSALQPEFSEFTQAITDSGANYARSGSDLVTMVKLRSEAAAQGVDVDIWECTIACYSAQFIEEAGEVAEGTYMTIFSLPFEEADTNAELADYVAAIGRPSSFGANAWASGVAFEEAIARIVDSDGINGISRTRILDELSTLDEFDANGMIGPVGLSSKTVGPCYVLLQVRDGEFVRVHPLERGTFDCSAENVVEITLDAEEEAGKF
ncbi:MAG: ABC transporter substrate-binding protein [Acidimicrobiia bacterium]|nr:ABC transporter substrate-binding protein [Acidimicrobiia bacterium]